ncbi:hypothetical protein [Pontibacter sp. SGAir0037]|uniref:hypothetical protein n=1 Tax=Pontibacter sp. SGAir0037 TaxID=2571030 RepID=UPI0010CD573C|nr:hypothetical protein [Pontibacter sp. SGAir0037]QCR20911.1 hypothetical protein C1N53_00075 [Pontibacter sp. SGAir0037]
MLWGRKKKVSAKEGTVLALLVLAVAGIFYRQFHAGNVSVVPYLSVTATIGAYLFLLSVIDKSLRLGQEEKQVRSSHVTLAYLLVAVVSVLNLFLFGAAYKGFLLALSLLLLICLILLVYIRSLR